MAEETAQGLPQEIDLSAAGTGDDPQQGEPDNQEQMVPVSVVQSIREELREIKDRNVILESAIRESRIQQNPQPQKKPDPLQDLDDDDIITKGQIMRVIGMKEHEFVEKMAMDRMSSKPDFDVLMKEHLPNMLKADPSLVNDLQGLSPSKQMALAYRMAKQDPAYIKKLAAQDKTTPSKTPERVKDNLTKPRSPAAVGGTASAGTPASAIMDMSDKEFAEYRRKVLSG